MREIKAGMADVPVVHRGAHIYFMKSCSKVLVSFNLNICDNLS